MIQAKFQGRSYTRGRKPRLVEPWCNLPSVQIALKTSIVESLDKKLLEESKNVKANELKFENRWICINEQQEDLSDALNMLQVLLNDCGDKRTAQLSIREVAATETKTYVEQTEKDRKSIQSLERSLENLVQRTTDMDAFKEFLESVVDADKDEYKNIQDVLHRAHNLLHVRGRMFQAITDNQLEIIIAKRRMAWAFYWKVLASVRQSKGFNAAVDRQEDLIHQLALLEKLLVDVGERTRSRCTGFARIQACVTNLYYQLSKTLLIDPIPLLGPSKQIRNIPVLVRELRKLATNIRNDYLMESDEAVVEVMSQEFKLK